VLAGSGAGAVAGGGFSQEDAAAGIPVAKGASNVVQARARRFETRRAIRGGRPQQLGPTSSTKVSVALHCWPLA
jgi:hypothetical protein